MNLLNVNQKQEAKKAAFAELLNKGVTLDYKLPVGEYDATFNALVVNTDKMTFTVKFTVDDKQLEDVMYFNPDKLGGLLFSLKELAKQLGFEERVEAYSYDDYNTKAGSPIKVWAVTPTGYKTVFYNYCKPIVKDETTSEGPKDGTDF